MTGVPIGFRSTDHTLPPAGNQNIYGSFWANKMGLKNVIKKAEMITPIYITCYNENIDIYSFNSLFIYFSLGFRIKHL